MATRQRPLPGFEPPNWTQVPNRLLDELLPLARSAHQFKLLLVLCRLTAGWHRTWSGACPLATLSRLTGMDAANISRALKRLIDAGHVERRVLNGASGQITHEYRLVIHDQDQLPTERVVKTTTPRVVKTTTLSAPIPDGETSPKERSLKKDSPPSPSRGRQKRTKRAQEAPRTVEEPTALGKLLPAAGVDYQGFRDWLAAHPPREGEGP